MYNIRSFYPKLGYLEDIRDWINQLKFDFSFLPKKDILIILNEAFANSLKVSPSEKAQITIVIREEISTKKILEIVVSDSGEGITLNGKKGDFPSTWINNKYSIIEHEGISVVSCIEANNQISFCLEPNLLKKEPLDHGRGLMSIIKLASQVKYVYAKKSFNYLFVRVER